MEEKYTISDLIDCLSSGLSRYHDANIEWEEDRSSFSGTLQCSGYSVDTLNGDNEWEENHMRYINCSPFFEEDDVDFQNDEGPAYRTHDYKSCYIDIRVNLPENRHRGDTYTIDEVMKMVEIIGYGDDVPGYGFEYYNCPDEDEG